MGLAALVRFHVSQVSTVPNRSSPFSARARALDVVEYPFELGGREIGVDQQPGIFADIGFEPGIFFSSSQMPAVRRHCQTMAL
jgi:hypothetical protein